MSTVTIHPVTIHPGTIHPGTIHPGTIHPGTSKITAIDAGIRRPAEGGTRRRLADTGDVRLTARGRIVVMLAVLLLAFGAFTAWGGPAASTATTHHAVAHTVVVSSGETLWDIAGRIAPGQDPRVVIAEIVDLNALADAGAIRVGQPLDVPPY